MSMNFLNFAPFHQPLNHYSLDHLIGFASTYPMDCDSSAELHYPSDKSLANG